MKKIALPALALAMVPFFSAPAAAWEGQVVECFDKVYVAPEYRHTKHLVKEASTTLEHRGTGKHMQMVRVHYPAIYEETRTLVRAGHYVMRPAACK